MATTTLITQLQERLEPTVQALGCELWGIEYLAQGKHSLLRIYIEKDEGISLADCERVSLQISALLDVEDPISGHYDLEVSSPGIERPLFNLAQYRRYIDSEVQVRLSTPVEKRRKFRGRLLAANDDHVVVEVDGEAFELPMAFIDKAKLCWSE